MSSERMAGKGRRVPAPRVFAPAVLLLAGAVLELSLLVARPGIPLRGFFPAGSSREAGFERIFRQVPTPEQARKDLRTLTESPHVAGTPNDFRTAEYVLSQFRKAGLSAGIVEYDVLLAYPKEVKVDLVEPIKRRGPTPEGGRERRKGAEKDLIPAFNAYSPSGDVTAPVVYANYGLPEDYQRLKEAGIEVAGKIVLVRYGRCFRGVKAFVADQNHAAGLLIYSDPADDGYRLGDVYPRGPWRPATAVQRGSILSLSDYAGDPLTPGVAATTSAKRLSIHQIALPRVPTTPLSYEDAAPMLEHLGGPVAPQDWQGALPLTYHFGPGPSTVHLKLETSLQVRPIWDVIARIPGAVNPDEWVVLGNHRDAWTYGAADPNSGTAPLLAVGRGFGRLLKQGWKPRRTLILASWDAEEFGLMGSTEWTEEHADELGRHAVAYLNVDVGVCGPHFGAAAVPSLSRLIREVAEEVTDPNTGRPLIAVWAEERGAVRKDSETPLEPASGAQLIQPPEARVRELGSGSDYTPFLEHLGVPSLDLGFSGAYGVYHSRYDDFDWMVKFGDPTFRYSVAASELLGILAMRLADADVLPLDYADYGKAIQGYFQDLKAELKRKHLDDRLALEDAVKAADEFTRVAEPLGHNLWQAEATAGDHLPGLQRVNQALLDVERDFLLEDGLPGRRWFRHAFYAPGVYTGYTAVLIPGVREAIDRKDWPLAAQELQLVVAALDRGRTTLEQAREALGGGSAKPSSR